MKYTTINSLKLDLYIKDKLTTSDFNFPYIEYIYLEDNTIKFNTADGIINYNFDLYKESEFIKFID